MADLMTFLNVRTMKPTRFVGAMTRITLRAVFIGAVLFALAGDCSAQRGIPIRFGPPVAPAHPVFFHGGHGNSNSSGDYGTIIAVIVVVVIVVIVVVGCVFGFRAWNRRIVGSIRIFLTPPGEAPEHIRRAWIGVTLPLRASASEPVTVNTVGILSGQPSTVWTGYAIDGRTAVEALDRDSTEAADWWRENAPHVLAPSYQMIFPVEVCERVDAGQI